MCNILDQEDIVPSARIYNQGKPKSVSEKWNTSTINSRDILQHRIKVTQGTDSCEESKVEGELESIRNPENRLGINYLTSKILHPEQNRFNLDLEIGYQSGSTDESFSEETKQFYHKPSSKKGIFDRKSFKPSTSRSAYCRKADNREGNLNSG